VGDAAYQPRTYMLTPFLGCKEGLSRERYFWNFIQSSTRMPVECAFGVLKLRWSILLKRLDVDTLFAPDLIACCIVLHNICQVHKDETNAEWYSELNEILRTTTPISSPSEVERYQPTQTPDPKHGVDMDSDEADQDDFEAPQDKLAYRVGVQYRKTLCMLLYDQERARNATSLGIAIEDESDDDVDFGT
jgi:hypothetical protein